jgi:hypothetical protein
MHPQVELPAPAFALQNQHFENRQQVRTVNGDAMQIVASNTSSYSLGGSEEICHLAKELERLSNGLSMASETRNQLRHVLMRINLEIASPLPLENDSELRQHIIESLMVMLDRKLPKETEGELRRLLLLAQGTHQSNQSLTIQCRLCNERHELKNGAFSFARPDAYYYTFPCHSRSTDQSARIHCAADFMAIDRSRFFIRGVLRLQTQPPIKQINIGVWTEVEQRDFSNYVDRVLQKLSGQAIDACPTVIMTGRLANRLYSLPESYNQRVEIECASKTDSASISILSANSDLARRLQCGLSAEDCDLMFSPFAHFHSQNNFNKDGSFC